MDLPGLPLVSLPHLQSALEASWDCRTAYRGAFQRGNPALGQCYPTSRVVQWFFPDLDIVAGEVDTGSSIEAHFWNIDGTTRPARHVDLTMQQFPQTSRVIGFRVLDRHALGDSPATVLRCRLLLQRVLLTLGRPGVGQSSRKLLRKAALSASERRWTIMQPVGAEAMSRLILAHAEFRVLQM